MKHLKRYLLLGLLVMYAGSTQAQSLLDVHAGLYNTFLSSDQLKSSMGLGVELGSQGQYKISKNFSFLATYNIYYSTFGVTGYERTGLDSKGNLTYNTGNISFFKYGLQYELGAMYFITPDEFSVSAGLSASYNLCVPLNTGSFTEVLPPPNDPASSAKYETDQLMTDLSGFDYGVHVGVQYRLPKMQFSLMYYKGLNNFTAAEGFNTSMNALMLGIHFRLREFSASKPFENKLEK